MGYEKVMPFRYRNAPLIESIFEFAPEGATFSGDAAQRVRASFGEYTGRSDTIRPMGIQVDWQAGRPLSVSHPNAPERIRQWNQANSRMVQFGADLCAFNALPPYSTFEDYVPDIARLVTAYQREIGTERTAFLGQRYLNRIVIPDEDPGTYFDVFSPVTSFARRPRPLSIQMEVEELEAGGNVMLTLAYQGRIGEQHQYLLDLYAHVGDNPQIPFRWEDVSAWQRAAHAVVERAFELPLTERCKAMLGREET